MATAGDAALVLEAMENDPRMLDLPPEALIVWLRLVRLMQAQGQTVLVYGSVVPSAAATAVAVRLSETQVGTQIPELLARGLLERRDDGALASPLLQKAVDDARGRGPGYSAAHAKAARINGLKGGRPPRSAGKVESGTLAGTPAVTTRDGSGSGLGSDLGSLLKIKTKKENLSPVLSRDTRVAAPKDWQRVGRLAFQAADLDDGAEPGNWGIVRKWMEDGASEALILDTIRTVRAKTPRPPRHLGYFSKEIMAAVAESLPKPPEDPAYKAAFHIYNLAWERWTSNGCFRATTYGSTTSNGSLIQSPCTSATA